MVDTQVVEVLDLHMRYGSTDVLHDVSFTVARGEVVCLLGPNGAGKTTTIEILEGLRRRSGGHVSVLGTDPAAAGEGWRARVGVALQSWRDHARWTPRQLLRHLGRYYEPYLAERGQPTYDLDALLGMVGLGELADRKSRTLSGGQRRRLDLAAAIVGRPELLFLDEPTAGLDPHARREFHDLVHHLSDMEGATVLMTTHDLAEAEKLADRILLLVAGRLVADGSADELGRRVGREAQVRWSAGGEQFVHSSPDPTSFVRELLAEHGDRLADLEVRRPTLEDTYLRLVDGTSSSGWAELTGALAATR